MPEIQPADPVARRRALLAAVAIAIVGWAAFFAVQEWLVNIRGLEPVRMRRALESAMVWGTWMATLPVVLFAAWLWLHGSRVLRAGRHPLPGAKVIRDTTVAHGDAARRRGAALRVLAVLLGLFGAGTLIAVYRLIAQIEG